MTDYPLLTEPAEVDELVATLLEHDYYAVDTEFHRERTYYPRLALVQIAWPGGLTLIDPLAVDIAPLEAVLRSDAVAIMHASSQDLEVLERACGTIPTTLFDTQVAAGFVGMRSPSLASLHDQLLGIRLPKGDRLTDWLQRPLEDRQLAYAAGDVEHLLEIADALRERLVANNRLQWAEDECELVRARSAVTRDPDGAWRRIKEARSLRGKAQNAAWAIAAWRERRAMKLDQPPRYILSDLAVVSMAQRPPKNVDGFHRIRGLDERHLKADDKAEIVAALDAARDVALPVPAPTRSRETDRDMRPAVTLVAAWLAQFASDRNIDPALIGSRSDIEELLRGDDGARLGSGWRQRLVGEPISRLVDGNVAIAFDGNGRLALEERSGRPFVVPEDGTNDDS